MRPSSIRDPAGGPLRREASKKVLDVRSGVKRLTAVVSVDTSRINRERQPCRCDSIAGRSRTGGSAGPLAAFGETPFVARAARKLHMCDLTRSC
jgi:hypothetical protein